jgi:hypothetical protein
MICPQPPRATHFCCRISAGTLARKECRPIGFLERELTSSARIQFRPEQIASITAQSIDLSQQSIGVWV